MCLVRPEPEPEPVAVAVTECGVTNQRHRPGSATEIRVGRQRQQQRPAAMTAIRRGLGLGAQRLIAAADLIRPVDGDHSSQDHVTNSNASNITKRCYHIWVKVMKTIQGEGKMYSSMFQV